MADNPTEEPASPTDPPRKPTSPPTRKQRSNSLPPTPRTPPKPRKPRKPPEFSTPQKPESPPTRVQAQGDTPPSPDSSPNPNRAPSPPTRKQGPKAAPPSPPTRQEQQLPADEPAPAKPDDVPTLVGTDPPTRREARTAPRAQFPQGLLDRYEPYSVSGAGSEGTVWHVRRVADGTDAAVKIAHPGQTMDMDTLEHLATPEFRRHVPVIHEFGDIAVGQSVCGWVAMEYLPTTFEDHLTRRLRDGKPREDRAHAERTVRELADLLDFWQTRVDRNPLDLKPANILVRQRSSGSGSGPRKSGRHEFVVADFGGVARFTASQSYRDFQITALYMAPEQIVNQNLKATPWWTLGLVLYQVFTGRPLYVLGDDARITDEAWTRSLIVNHEVDLSAVTDARQNLLLQGLLTKDPDDRWTAREVRRWLKGEDPPVVRPAAPADAPAARHANRPITFRGTAHHEAESLAAAMAQHSQEAADWLAGGDGPRLAAWLRDELEDTSYDSGQLLALKRGPDKAVRAAVAALAFVAVFAPTATPQYRGRRVDAEGIARIAQGQGAVAFIDELLKANVPAVAAGFRCAHTECAGGRCVVLLALADELPRTIEDVRARARRLGRRAGGGDGGNLDQLETDRAYGLAAMLIVHPGQRGQALVPLAGLPGPLSALLTRMPVGLLAFLVGLGALRHRSVAVLRRRAQDGGFLRRWADLHRRAADGDVGTVTGRAALVAAAVLLPRAVRADAIGQDHQVTLAEWWSAVRPPLVRRGAAGAVLFMMLWLLLWSGTMLRFVYDSGLGWEALDPADRLTAPLARAADLASATQTGLCAVALAGAVAFAAAPARLSVRPLLVAAALAAYVGYARPDLPPLDRFNGPDWATERLRHLLGGWQSWNGVAALLVVPLVALVLMVVASRLHGQARTAEEERTRLRRERAEQRRVRVGLPRLTHGDPARWRTGSLGTRDRALFALAALFTMVILLWAAVETRVALDGEHPTLASWGTGQQGASYQSQYVLVCAAACVLAALASPALARRIFIWGVVAVLALGLWPPPVEPARALSMPVVPDLFDGIADNWGHAAFWAALLLALPLSLYAGGFALHRTRRAAR
jgi:hypothetical protein